MRMRDLTREGGPAFPPKWSERYTGADTLLSDPLEGVLAAVEWGRGDQSIQLTNYWHGRRLIGTLVLDDARLLARVYALLSANISVPIDEIAEMEVPGA